MDTVTENAFEAAGRAAALHGLSREHNPYLSGTEEAAFWDHGWALGRQALADEGPR